MPGDLQPLSQNFPIVDERGNPTLYFIKWAQARQIDITGSITAEQALEIVVSYLAAHPLQEGSGINIAPSGDLTDSPTISAEVQAILDQISTTRGTVLFRGASDWQALAPGTNGHFLRTNGAGADPSWAAGGGGGNGGSKYLGYYTGMTAGQNRTIAAGAWIGKFIIVDKDCSITHINSFFRNANAATTLTPAIYACGNNGLIGNLKTSGNTVTGAIQGLQRLPLTTPYSALKGELLYIGFICHTSNPDSVSCSEKGAVFFIATSDVPPATPPATTYGEQTNWVPIWGEIE